MGEKCDLSTGSEVGEMRRLEPTQCRVVRERRRTLAILRNGNIAKNHPKNKVEENRQTNKNVSRDKLRRRFSLMCVPCK